MRTLIIEPGEYVVCRVAGSVRATGASKDLWAAIAFGDETTLICRYGEEPILAEAERGWRWVRLEAEMGFDSVGVMASMLDPLRIAGVSILALSSFYTDHILVKDSDLPRAEAAWREAGFTVQAR